jgi:hypothetical protein
LPGSITIEPLMGITTDTGPLAKELPFKTNLAFPVLATGMREATSVLRRTSGQQMK